ncbi:hypothetical protein Q3G72_004628 [Acer saccharum]|nr:hypothetical protein Q3G72_004628 [Acer saccharum]
MGDRRFDQGNWRRQPFSKIRGDNELWQSVVDGGDRWESQKSWTKKNVDLGLGDEGLAGLDQAKNYIGQGSMILGDGCLDPGFRPNEVHLA